MLSMRPFRPSARCGLRRAAPRDVHGSARHPTTSALQEPASPAPERSLSTTLRCFGRIAALFLLISGSPLLADEVRRETVQFARGSSGATLTSQVSGYESVQYTLGVAAGQKMSVQLDSRNSSLYFNVTAPGASEALYNSSINGNGTTVAIPSSGNYVIDVYLMRNAARRGETADYTLTLYVE